MNKLRNLITAAVAAITLSSAVLEATPSSAHGFFHPWGHGGGHFHNGFHWHNHWHNHWGYHWHYRFGYHCRYHWHRWGYHFGGYRPFVVSSAPEGCPVGMHLGYLGKHCWPNH